MKIVIVEQVDNYLFEGDESDANSASAKRLIARGIAKPAESVGKDELSKLKASGAKAREKLQKEKEAEIKALKEKAEKLKK